MLIHSRVFEAYLDKMNLITIILPKARSWGEVLTFTLLAPNGYIETLRPTSREEHEYFYKLQCITKSQLEVGECYTISIGDLTTDLQVGAVIRTEEFDEKYAYDGDDLGANYQPDHTTFKVWAPSASSVTLVLFDIQHETRQEITMSRKRLGIWEVNIQGNWDGFYYTYRVCVNKISREAVDPYAKSVSINGQYGVVINGDKLHNSRVIVSQPINVTDAIIYETHIRDFTIHPESGIIKKGTYKGFIEEPSECTCINHVMDLGITHIELLPVNDFDGIDEENPDKSYNWGYNPLHYFAPEGSYSSNPKDPYARILELQELVYSLHEKGIRVILDVVYNHVYIKEESSFEKIVPGYYFRYDQNGLPSNGTGVGNDIASERRMVRKFIVDCVLYWIQTYKVDGFRFDLMGILDIETMNLVRDQVQKLNPSIVLLGEGWELNTPLAVERKATTRNAHLLPGIAFFNDRFRDVIKGSTFNLYDRGYSLGNNHLVEEAKQVISGSISFQDVTNKGMFLHPTSSINYVESHDNHTYWDKMVQSNSYETIDILRKRQKLATSIVLLSQGIPFLHSGQEFYRTKQGDGNSYRSSDMINQLDWDRRKEYHLDVEYIKGIIQIRKSHQAFRLPQGELVRKHLSFFQNVPEGVISFELKNVIDYGEWEKIIVILYNGLQDKQVDLGEKQSWNVLADELSASPKPLYRLQTKKVIIKQVSILILAR
ncbi:type I pullulanase [Bacillus salitolerans]|uniref:Type I pullulanase n=1 Tax=Bacillus salitolerans TaxID=1437434 RepID=A0ABW4LWU5_9BACI